MDVSDVEEFQVFDFELAHEEGQDFLLHLVALLRIFRAKVHQGLLVGLMGMNQLVDDDVENAD